MQITGNYHAIRKFYADERVWSDVDAWHSRTIARITTEVAQIVRSLPSPPRAVANIGSGGISYDIEAPLHVHVDLVPERLRGCAAVLANAEELPFRDDSFDLVLCVGSVINHGNAVKMIREIARVLAPEGMAVVEFDCSDGLHQVNGARGADCVDTNTFFNRHMLTLKEFSRTHIERALEAGGLTVVRRHSFHILSALILGFGFHPSLAARFIQLDSIARCIPALRYRGSNLLIAASRA